jgi:putative SOS response-associated peptidase YedK
MCGRYVVARELNELEELFQAERAVDFQTVSFNIAPTNSVPIVVEREIDSMPSREIHSARFGLIPHWAKEVPAPLFNARIETVLEKPSFRESAIRKRCVIPASGYFEWDAKKQPHFIHSESIVAFAGIYSFWRDPAKSHDDPSRWVLSASILTKAGSPSLAWVHERSPVFLSEDGVDAWLAPDYETTPEVLDAICLESDEVAETLIHHPVAKEVGKVSENHKGLIAPLRF